MAKPAAPRIKVGIFTYAMHGGGMEMALLRLGKYLQESGMDVEITTLSEKGAWFPKIAEAGLSGFFLSHQGLETTFKRGIHYLKTLNYILGKRYDIVFLNHTRYAHRAVPFLKLFTKTKAVAVLHNTDPSIFEIGLIHASFLDSAVAVGPLVQSLAEQRNPKCPVIQIRNGVDTPETLGLVSEEPFPRFTLVFVGRLEHAQKGVLFLPDIVKGCQNQGLELQLIIAGTGEDEPELRRLVSEKGLEKEIQFVGPLETKEVYRLLLKSHLMLMPSYFEGFSVVLLEAQMCGCLPLVTRLEEITTPVVQDGETGFLIDGNDNIDMFVEKITYLYTHRQRLEEMKAASMRLASQNYSVQAMGERYHDLIFALVKGDGQIQETK
ncbi:glycosyltransferase family 4 protein [Rufibacter latericius]|uniref:Glycosyltransferase family 1 protein n=1 Tax=Rufibacter latericius TaxID=2487040 RepID=A0A3M9MA54_9BACT|nr:glycosyltransferase family 4 protein [Rufibacter latericius]RNI22450.1 glycosyltransferase family 1 protein [Rufibacter latericius]